MTMPFYVSPEQLMADRADFARKGISKGRSVIVAQYGDGIAFVAENHSKALHKISEIYDRIGFAAVGKYNEFESLRIAGIRYADMRGYTYDRSDVNGRGLANAYSQTLAEAFTNNSKPHEVELVVADVGADVSQDLMYRISFDGSVAEENDFVVMGGFVAEMKQEMNELWEPNLTLAQILDRMITVLSAAAHRRTREPVTEVGNASEQDNDIRRLAPDQLEAAVLDRTRPRRTFRRLSATHIAQILGE